MRPQQQNRRMRGRNNNNNRGKGSPNPLTRSYESNGPDVKIRGNAQQIAEKYSTLARDAMSSGDRVMAENYLQHAEHYNRIIAAAQAQMPIQNFQQNRDDFDDDDGEERDEFDVQAGDQPQPNGNGGNGSGPQPVIEGVPAEVALNGGANGGDNQQRPRDGYRNRDGRDREGRNRDRNRDSQGRNGEHQRRDFQRRDDQQGDQQDNLEQPPLANEAQAEQTPDATDDALPDFLTNGAPAAADAAPQETAPRRSRRPRRGERSEPKEAEAQASEPAVDASGESLAPAEG